MIGFMIIDGDFEHHIIADGITGEQSYTIICSERNSTMNIYRNIVVIQSKKDICSMRVKRPGRIARMAERVPGYLEKESTYIQTRCRIEEQGER